MLPILYSFRRCPYAIRARMTLQYASLKVELREVFLGEKPPAMLEASSKGTVPILVLPDGRVLDESAEVMRWALGQHDPDRWWREDFAAEAEFLFKQNDRNFKTHLDQYKYWERFPEQPQAHYRAEAEEFLQQLELRLLQHQYLVDDEMTISDVAIFPFVRQFAFVDKLWFDQSPYPQLQLWLQSFLVSPLFTATMTKYPMWREGDAPRVFPV